jgi:hypothetical protein
MKHDTRTTGTLGIALMLTAGLSIAGCGTTEPTLKQPNPNSAETVNAISGIANPEKPLEQQAWIDQPRTPVPAGAAKISSGYAQMAANAPQSVNLVTNYVASPVGLVATEASEWCGAKSRIDWQLSADKATIRRTVVNCQGLDQIAILNRSDNVYIGDWININTTGAIVASGPMMVTPAKTPITNLGGTWKVELAGLPSKTTNAPANITINADGSHTGECGTSTLKYDGYLNRNGICNTIKSTLIASGFHRDPMNLRYTGFHSAFNANNAPIKFGPQGFEKSITTGGYLLEGKYVVNSVESAIDPVFNTQGTLNLNANGKSGCSTYSLSPDKKTLLEDFTACPDRNGTAHMNRIPGTNTYVGYRTMYVRGTPKQFLMGPLQVTLDNLTSTNPGTIQAPIFVPNAKPKIVTEPSSALVDVNQELVINAKVADINGKNYPASGLEWKSLNPNVLQIVALENNGLRARVKITQANQGGQLLVRSKDDGSIVSDVLLVANASLQPNVRTIADADVAFPPKQWDLYSSTLPAGLNNTNVVAFTPSEIAALIKTQPVEIAPMVARGTNYAIGNLVLAGGGAAVNGRIESVSVRNGYSLLGIKAINPEQLIRNMVFNSDTVILKNWVSSAKDVVKLSAVSAPAQPGNMRAQQDFDLPGGISCKTSVDKSLIDQSIKASASIQPIFDFGPTVRDGISNTEVTLGVRVPLTLTGSVALQPTFSGEVKCSIKNLEQTFDVPISGPFSAFALSGGITGVPVVKLKASLTGTKFSTELKGTLTPLASIDFSYGRNGVVFQKPVAKLEKQEFTVDPVVADKGGLGIGISQETKLSAGIDFTAGLQLGGTTGSKLRAGINKAPPNPISNKAREIIDLFSYIKFLKGFTGLSVKYTWVNEILLKAQKKNVSASSLNIGADLGFQNDQLDLFIEGLKKLGINGELSVQPLVLDLELLKLYTGFVNDSFKINGATAADPIKLNAKSNNTLSLRVKAETPNTATPALIRGKVEIVGVGTYDLTGSGLDLTGSIPGSVCDKLTAPSIAYVFAYNNMYNTKITASYIGQYTISCGTPPTDGGGGGGGDVTVKQLEDLFKQFKDQAKCAGQGSILGLRTTFTKIECSTPASLASKPSKIYVLELNDNRETRPDNGPRTSPFAQTRQVCLITHRFDLVSGGIGSVSEGVTTGGEGNGIQDGTPFGVGTYESRYYQAFNVNRPVNSQTIFQSYYRSSNYFQDTKKLYKENRKESQFAAFFEPGAKTDLENAIAKLPKPCTRLLPL